MSADRCYTPPATDKTTLLTRAALDIEELNTDKPRDGWSTWYLSGQWPVCRLEGTVYVVRLVRPAGTKVKRWYWGRAGRPGGQPAESAEAAQIAAEAAAAIDAVGREL